MSVASAVALKQQSQAPPQSDNPAGTVESCLDLTTEALLTTRAASQVEVSHALDLVRKAAAEHFPVDLVEAVARSQGHHEEHLAGAVMTLADKIASTLNPVPPLVPFAGKLIAPSAFYESFEHLHTLARALLTPVIFAEDTDSIGVASLNPIAANLLSTAIQDSVGRRFGIRPFLTIVRLDYESWTFLCRKHFEL
ncbi:MAG: hypothetical protein K9N23_16300 [Akkermansiaceae bacterium]|nr:hypothetical protein [Akkermansiaceae bacterium]MCF7733253.1 hypothetical protein [Akkermansiaceae bacterium]